MGQVDQRIVLLHSKKCVGHRPRVLLQDPRVIVPQRNRMLLLHKIHIRNSCKIPRPRLISTLTFTWQWDIQNQRICFTLPGCPISWIPAARMQANSSSGEKLRHVSWFNVQKSKDSKPTDQNATCHYLAIKEAVQSVRHVRCVQAVVIDTFVVSSLDHRHKPVHWCQDLKQTDETGRVWIFSI